MKISPVTNYNNRLAFGRVILGDGGAERIIYNTPISDQPRQAINEVVLSTKMMIGRNVLNPNHILITEKEVKILPQSGNTVLKVGDVFARGDKFTDIEVSKDGVSYIFRLDRELSDKEINKFGTKNRQIVFADAIANRIRGSFDLSKYMRKAEPKQEHEKNNVLPKWVPSVVRDLQIYANNCGLFD